MANNSTFNSLESPGIGFSPTEKHPGQLGNSLKVLKMFWIFIFSLTEILQFLTTWNTLEINWFFFVFYGLHKDDLQFFHIEIFLCIADERESFVILYFWVFNVLTFFFLLSGCIVVEWFVYVVW